MKSPVRLLLGNGVEEAGTPQELVPQPSLQASSMAASQQDGDPLFYLPLSCNPSVIPPVFKDASLIVLNAHSTPQKRIRLPLTQRPSCSGTFRSKGFPFPSVTGARTSLPAGDVDPFCSASSRESVFLNKDPTVCTVWESFPPWSREHTLLQTQTCTEVPHFTTGSTAGGFRHH